MSKKCVILGKVFKWEEKTTSTGKKYVDLTLTDSTKLTDGNWETNYYHVKIWNSYKNYDDTLKFLKSVKTVAAAKKEADKIEFVGSFELGENFKTHEKEIQYSFYEIRKFTEDTTPSVSKPTKYDAPAVVEEKKSEEDEELPF